MLMRKIPGTDLELSAVGFGCWAIGGKWWGDDVTDEDSVDAVHAALDVGINWFDTAPLYGYGHADEVLKKALGKRIKDVVLATKCGVRWDSDGDHAQSDCRPEHVRWDVEQSLARFGVERLDLVQIHWPCEVNTPFEATLGELHTLQDEGKIGHIGVCNYSAAALDRICELSDRIVSLQCGYSMIRREHEASTRKVTRRRRLGVIAYEPLGRGILSGKYTALELDFPLSDLRRRDARFHGNQYLRIRSLVNDLAIVAKRARTTPAALAIAWVIQQQGITAAVFGAKRAEQVRQNVDAVRLVGHQKLWDFMKNVVNSYRG